MKRFLYLLFSKNAIIAGLILLLLLFIIHLFYIYNYEKSLRERETTISRVVYDLKTYNFITFDNEFHLMAMVRFCLEKEETNEGLLWAELLIMKSKLAPISYRYRGDVYYFLGDYEKACDDYLWAISKTNISYLDEELEHALIGLAKSHYQLGKTTDSAEEFVKAILGFDQRDKIELEQKITMIMEPLLEFGPKNKKISPQNIIELLQKEQSNLSSKTNTERAIYLLKIID
jgi:tetratricopeptide (TPR) repeat protein